MQWFGDAFEPSDMFPPDDCLPVPVGDACEWCGEPIAFEDSGVALPCSSGPELSYRHRECFLREMIGSVGHQLKVCTCYGGDFEDPPELSRREAARAAVQFWESGRHSES
jgi:hypothetical protein